MEWVLFTLKVANMSLWTLQGLILQVLFYLPASRVLHLLAQVAMAKLLCVYVRGVQVGAGDALVRRKILGTRVKVCYNVFGCGQVYVLILSEFLHRTRHILILLSGTIAMGLCGFVIFYAMWQAGELGYIPKTDLMPPVFLIVVLADCLSNLVPVSRFPPGHGTSEAHRLWRILHMRNEDVKWSTHNARGDYCESEGKHWMAVYHYMRSWRFIAKYRGFETVLRIANSIFQAGQARPGKAKRSCEMLVLLANRSDVYAGVRSKTLNLAASYALYELPKPTMMKEAVEWTSQALEFDSTDREIRATKGAVCLEMGWMQDAKANLMAVLAWEDAPKRVRIQASVCYARVLAWMGDLPNARKLLEETPGLPGDIASGMVERVRREAYAEIERTLERWKSEAGKPKPTPMSQPFKGKKHKKRK